MLGLLIRSCFEITNTKVRRTLYLTLVRSQLTYGCETWCPGSRQLSLKIEGVHRRATLWILMKNRGDLSYVERLIRLNLIPLVYDREQKHLILYYKCKKQYDRPWRGTVCWNYVNEDNAREPLSFEDHKLAKLLHCKVPTLLRLLSYGITFVRLLLRTALTLPSFKTYLHKTYLQLTATAYDPDLPSSHSLINYFSLLYLLLSFLINVLFCLCCPKRLNNFWAPCMGPGLICACPTLALF